MKRWLRSDVRLIGLSILDKYYWIWTQSVRYTKSMSTQSSRCCRQWERQWETYSLFFIFESFPIALWSTFTIALHQCIGYAFCVTHTRVDCIWGLNSTSLLTYVWMSDVIEGKAIHNSENILPKKVFCCQTLT